MSSQLKWKCPQCAAEVVVPANHNGIKCFCGFRQFCNPPGIGDKVAAALAKVGVTEERYNEVRKRLRLRGKCRCKQRQQFLNRLNKAANDGN